MKTWIKILPFFVVEYLATKNLQIWMIKIGSREAKVVNPYKGVYIEL